jgi:outer membrane receptor for ferrienterochelin and colicins
LKTFILAIILPLILFCDSLKAQNTFHCIIKDSISGETIPGVFVLLSGTNKGVVSDTNGNASLSGIQDGMQSFEISMVGYTKKTISLKFPQPGVGVTAIVVDIVPSSFEMDAVTVTATRNNSRLDDLPIKVEVLGQDEMLEESGIKPGSVASLLMDNSGVQIQQISAASGNVEVKMLGLSGKYTQMLRDGHPLYEGFSGGLGVLNIPPLDLKQIEIIKGSVSTLYGGGAIGGIINLVSKEPSAKPEFQVLLNATTLKELTSNAYYSCRSKRVGYSIFCGATLQDKIDVDKDGFSDVPEYKYYLIHPRIFFYFNKNTVLRTGLSILHEYRIGGDMLAVPDSPDTVHTYFERNYSDRQTMDIDFTNTSATKNIFSLKLTASRNLKDFDISNVTFKGEQYSVYSEVSYLIKGPKHSTVMGLNYISESFEKKKPTSVYFGNFADNTFGAFIQDDWNINKKLTIESGIRSDYQKNFNPFILPRLALLYHFSKEFSTRLNVGTGYLAPNIFSDINAINHFSSLLPVSRELKAERSEGINAELNYFKVFPGDLTLTLNQSFYYTRVENPAILQTDTSGFTSYQTAPYYIDTKGSDTYVRMTYLGIELYLGYTMTDPQSHQDSKATSLPLTPKSKMSYVITCDIEDSWRFGLESSYQSFQYLENGGKVQGYWFYAAVIQKQFGKFFITLNCENLFDFRQNKIEEIVMPPYSNPTFKTLWAPIDGRVVNLAIRVKL